MPETTVTLHWPDGDVQEVYSPSLVIHEHLEPGRTYSVADVVERSRTALTIAGDRVREKFGFACGQAVLSMQAVEGAAGRYAPTDPVRVAP